MQKYFTYMPLLFLSCIPNSVSHSVFDYTSGTSDELILQPDMQPVCNSTLSVCTAANLGVTVLRAFDILSPPPYTHTHTHTQT
jgi:hypothetical protein